MRKLALVLAAFPLMAMSLPPSVPAGNEPVPVAELNALLAVNACVQRAYNAKTGLAHDADGYYAGYANSQTSIAREAQRVNNAPAFSTARANVVRTVRELGYPC